MLVLVLVVIGVIFGVVEVVSVVFVEVYGNKVVVSLVLLVYVVGLCFVGLLFGLLCWCLVFFW